MTRAFYNEIDQFAAEWLRNLIAAGEITPGVVDERSIHDLTADDLVGYERVHLFAGIGGWDLALNLAGWSGPVWTGSCPCQPFSSAGKRRGAADERHLWPEMFRLIEECRPPVVFGEQVASKDGLRWLDGVFADLEGAGYACGAADTCAAGAGAPHIRQRLFWVADASADMGLGGLDEPQRGSQGRAANRRTGAGPRRLAYTGRGSNTGLVLGRGGPDEACGGLEAQRLGEADAVDSGRGEVDGLGHADLQGPQGRWLDRGGRARELSPWSASVVIPCRDGKARRISSESSDVPLAHGLPRQLGPALAGLGRVGVRTARTNRVGRLRGYGNAIVPEVASGFVLAFVESRP